MLGGHLHNNKEQNLFGKTQTKKAIWLCTIIDVDSKEKLRVPHFYRQPKKEKLENIEISRTFVETFKRVESSFGILEGLEYFPHRSVPLSIVLVYLTDGFVGRKKQDLRIFQL